MGGEIFFTVGIGDNPCQVFDNLVEEARYDYGHSGYTGTIAEKEDFIMVKTFLSKFKIFNFKSAELCFEESFSNRMFEGFKTLF